METEGHFLFEKDELGSFQFGLVQGQIDYRIEKTGEVERLEFSWDGRDENDEAAGRGWAVIKNDQLEGRFYFHSGDNSWFKAKKYTNSLFGGKNTCLKGRGKMKIVSIAVSKKKGTRKTSVREAFLAADHGIEGDAHAGNWHRQVSFLASESIETARSQGLDVTFGDFAENIATTGIDWVRMPVGTQVRLGETALVEITQIGKECHKKCAIYYQAGDCIMPREGVFGRVLRPGKICCGDTIQVVVNP